MRTLCIVFSIASVVLAACTPAAQQTNATAPPGHFDSVTISGSNTVGDVFLKVNSATGATSFYCCQNFNFTAIADPVAPPPGDYHLKAWYVIAGDGSVTWVAYRFDQSTGHTWVLMHERGGQYQWQAITN
jgi:hypothetical protein